MEFYDFKFVCMTTSCRFQVYGGSYEKAKECFEKIKENSFYLEKKYNFYDENSYLTKHINQRNKNKIKVDSKTASILKQVRDLSIKTNNCFDITIGTLKKCYQNDSLDLLEESLEENIFKTGINSWDINNRNLEFKYEDTIIDLGGVIKEFAVDEAVKIAQSYNISSAIINFGGDIFVIGSKLNGEKFNIGIKNPLEPEENLVIVSLENQALTTSANYERQIRVEDKMFSHIISKNKNSNNFLSSTVISNSTLKSGIYSTSFMIDSNIDITYDLKVVLIDHELRLHQNLQ